MNVNNSHETEYHDKWYGNEERKKILRSKLDASRWSKFFWELISKYSLNKDVLDYGCGDGVLSFKIGSNYKSITGIDISSVGVEKCKEKARELNISNSKFYVMNAENTELDDNSFDLIAGLAVLHHLSIEKAYCEISRLLRKGGLAVFSEPLGHNPILRLYRFFTPKIRTKEEHPLLLKDIKLANKYFNSVETHFYYCFSLLSSLKVFKSLNKKLDHFDEMLFSKFPYLKRYAWKVVLILSDPRKN